MTSGNLFRSVRLDIEAGALDEDQAKLLLSGDAADLSDAQLDAVGAEFQKAVILALRRLRAHGPDRFVVDAEGTAVPLSRLRENAKECCIKRISLILFRKDGWTLAALPGFEKAAYRLWRDEWAGYIAEDYMTPMPICGNEEWTK